MVHSILSRDIQYIRSPVDCQIHTTVLLSVCLDPYSLWILLGAHTHICHVFMFNFSHIFFTEEVHPVPISDMSETISPIANRECPYFIWLAMLSLLWHRMSLECCVCHHLHIFNSVELDYPVCLFLSVCRSVISLLFASATPSTSLSKAHGPADNVTALQANTESYLLIFSPIWFEDSIVAETFYTDVSWNSAGLFPHGCTSSSG